MFVKNDTKGIYIMNVPKALYSFEELMDGKIGEIPTDSGVYFVLAHPEFEYNYLSLSDGIKTYKGKPTSKSLEKLQHVGNIHKDSGSQILYIGSANNLQERIKQFMNWGYELVDRPHSGGKMLWQIKNNKKFKVAYMLSREPEQDESIMIDQHVIEYHCFPFANEKRGKREFGLLTNKEFKRILNK